MSDRTRVPRTEAREVNTVPETTTTSFGRRFRVLVKAQA